jgi:hypothetical protein
MEINMNKNGSGKTWMRAVFAACVLAASAGVNAQAQAPASGAPSGQPAAGVQGASAAPTSRAELKAQRKAERKARRAAKNAELNKLGQAGYKPANQDPNYPQNLLNAEKNAAGQTTAGH